MRREGSRKENTTLLLLDPPMLKYTFYFHFNYLLILGSKDFASTIICVSVSEEALGVDEWGVDYTEIQSAQRLMKLLFFNLKQEQCTQKNE